MKKINVSLVSLILVISAVLLGCESKEAETKRKDAAYDSCIESYSKNCTRACETDPKFMYCSTKHGSNVVGSGCVSFMNSHSKSEQVSICKKEACQIDYETIKACTQRSR